ncbi:hypothetical protein VTO58DRAFT_111212 [Aureobasidium pullulans]
MKRLTLNGFTKRGLSRVVVVVVRSRKARLQCDLWKAAKFASSTITSGPSSEHGNSPKTSFTAACAGGDEKLWHVPPRV